MTNGDICDSRDSSYADSKNKIKKHLVVLPGCLGKCFHMYFHLNNSSPSLSTAGVLSDRKASVVLVQANPRLRSEFVPKYQV